MNVTLANTGANTNKILVTPDLPAGAATAAKQPALGTAGTASADVITVQGIASMTAIKVDNSAVTQPVSAASLPLPTGAATSAKQDTAQTALDAIKTAAELIDDTVATDDTTTHATGTTKVMGIGAVAVPTDASVNANDIAMPAMTTDRKLHVAVMDALPAGTAAIGKLAANSGVDIGDVDITSIAAGDNTIGRVKLTDGTLVASVRDTGASDSLNVAIVDGSGTQITSFGGGTQYTEADVDTTITGTAMMWEDASDTLRAVSAAKPLPVDIQDASVAVTNAGTFAVQDATAQASLSVLDDWDETDRAKVNSIVGQAGVAAGAGTDSAATQRVTPSTGATSTLTNVADVATSTTLLSAAATRRKFVMHNDSTSDCYVKYGTTASATSYTWKLGAGDHIEEEHYNGRVDGIWASDASGSMRITEIT